MRAILILLILCSILGSSRINILPRSKRYEGKKTNGGSSILEKIHRQNSKINELLLKKSHHTEFQDQTLAYDLPTGTIAMARLETPITSSNLTSPIVAKTTANSPFPKGARIVCKGEVKNQRIYVTCNLLIIGLEEYSIGAQLLNLDRSAGLKGSIYTGNDEKVAGIISANIFERMTEGISKTISPGRDEIAKIIRQNARKRQKTIIHIESNAPVLI